MFWYQSCKLCYLVHGGEQLPVVVGEFGGDVFRAHLFQDVGRSSLRTLLLLQWRLGGGGEQTEEDKCKNCSNDN